MVFVNINRDICFDVAAAYHNILQPGHLRHTLTALDQSCQIEAESFFSIGNNIFYIIANTVASFDIGE